MIKNDLLSAWGKRLCAQFLKYKYVLLIILAGMLLLIMPAFSGGDGVISKKAAEETGTPFDVRAVELALEAALSRVDGAGQVTVVLTLKSGVRQVLAQDSKTSRAGDGAEGVITTVVLSGGAGTQETVPVQWIAPQFQGALVICPGGGDPAVQLQMAEAVSKLTGLGSDKISICKGK